MKRMRRASVAAVCLLGATVGLVVAQGGEIGFGVKEAVVKARLVDAVVGGSLQFYPNGKAYHAAGVEARVAFVKAVLSVMKAYSETPAFRAEYAKRREGAKPDAAQAKVSADDQANAALAEQRKQLAETKAELAKMSPDMQKQMEPIVKQLEESISMQANDPDTKAMNKQIYEEQAKAEQARYQENLADWKKNFPEAPNQLIARRLKEFLQLTAGINFDAKLTPLGGGRMKFADQQFEEKDNEWKVCFRAGREPVAAARARSAQAGRRRF